MKMHETELRLRERPSETITLRIPTETLTTLKKVADRRDMSWEGLVKLYIGTGLRADLATLFADQVLDATAEVLARHVQSAEEVSAIVKEIREQVRR